MALPLPVEAVSVGGPLEIDLPGPTGLQGPFPDPDNWKKKHFPSVLEKESDYV